jgi:hypothetical protein
MRGAASGPQTRREHPEPLTERPAWPLPAPEHRAKLLTAHWAGPLQGTEHPAGR